MPARYNCHYDLRGGYVYSGKVVVAHLWKDIRRLILSVGASFDQEED